MVPSSNATAEKLLLAQRLTLEFRKKLRKNLRAVGVVGSVARGTAQEYSDIDMLLIVKRNPESIPRDQIRDNTYCSINPETWKSAVRQINGPHSVHDYLPEILGGFTKIRALFDPERLFPRLEVLASKVPRRVFKKNAESILVHSYEDFCRAKNVFLHGDEVVLRENVWWVTHAAANIVSALNEAHFVSDREIFKAYKRLKRTPRGFGKIQLLRYGDLRGVRLFKLFLSFYVELVRFCRREGVQFPVEEAALKELGMS